MKNIKLFAAALSQTPYLKHSPFVPGIDPSLLCTASQAQPTPSPKAPRPVYEPTRPAFHVTHPLLIALHALGSGYACRRASSHTGSRSEDGPAQHILPILCPATTTASPCPSPPGIPPHHTVNRRLVRIQSASIG